MLDVAGWFWDAVRVGSLVSNGALSPDSINAATWEIGEVAWAELEEARRSREAMAAKRREWIERHTKADDG